jgi:hypothetical protein
VLLFDVNIDTVNVEDFVVCCDIFDPLGFIFEPGATALPNGQADAFGLRLPVHLFKHMFDCAWCHGDGNGWCEYFGCHGSTSIRQKDAGFSAAP